MKGDKKKQEESRTPWKETQHPKWAKRRQESDMKGDKRKLGSVEGGHSISHKGGHTLESIENLFGGKSSYPIWGRVKTLVPCSTTKIPSHWMVIPPKYGPISFDHVLRSRFHRCTDDRPPRPSNVMTAQLGKVACPWQRGIFEWSNSKT